MKSTITILLFFIFSMFSTLSFSQSQQEKTAGAIEAARQQVESAQRSEFEQGKRDAILGHSSKNDFDNLGLLFLFSIVAFVGWKFFEHSRDKKEIEIGAQQLKEEHEEQRAERLEIRREAAAAREQKAIEIDIKKLEDANDTYKWLLSEEKRDGATNRIYIKFLTNQRLKHNFGNLFDIYAACFDKDEKILKNYGVYSNYTNATTDEDDSKYESIISNWELRSDLEDQCFTTLDIRAKDFDPNVSYIAIYLANGVRGDEFLKEFSTEVRLNGLESSADIFEFSPEPNAAEALINIGYLKRNENNWEFAQAENSQVDITFTEFTENKKHEILSRFQKSFVI